VRSAARALRSRAAAPPASAQRRRSCSTLTLSVADAPSPFHPAFLSPPAQHGGARAAEPEAEEGELPAASPPRAGGGAAGDLQQADANDNGGRRGGTRSRTPRSRSPVYSRSRSRSRSRSGRSRSGRSRSFSRSRSRSAGGGGGAGAGGGGGGGGAGGARGGAGHLKDSRRGDSGVLSYLTDDVPSSRSPSPVRYIQYVLCAVWRSTFLTLAAVHCIAIFVRFLRVCLCAGHAPPFRLPLALRRPRAPLAAAGARRARYDTSRLALRAPTIQSADGDAHRFFCIATAA
jgi:hypothetical protein